MRSVRTAGLVASGVLAAFEKQTGIKVAVRSDSESVVANQILREGGRSPVSASTLSAIPARYNSPAGDWVGVEVRAGPRRAPLEGQARVRPF